MNYNKRSIFESNIKKEVNQFVDKKQKFYKVLNSKLTYDHKINEFDNGNI